MKVLFQMKNLLNAGNICSILSIISVFFLTMVGGKPTKLLPKHAIEELYKKMIHGSKTTGGRDVSFAHHVNYHSTEKLQKLLESQYYVHSTQEKGTKTRVLIYSIASKGYLSVDGEKVYGRGSRNSKNTIIIIENIGFNKVRLQGEHSKKYICFNEKGRLEGKESGDHPNCTFKQYPLTNHYTAFRSVNELKWIGIRPTGTVKKGRRTKHGQRSTKFVIITL